MKWSEIIESVAAGGAVHVTAVPRELMRREKAASRVGAPQLFALMEKFNWIKPRVHRNRMTLFDSRDIERCIDRISGGEYPGEENQEALEPVGRSSMSRSEGDK